MSVELFFKYVYNHMFKKSLTWISYMEICRMSSSSKYIWWYRWYVMPFSHYGRFVGQCCPKLPHSPNSVTLRLIVRSRDTLLFHFEDEILFFERSFYLNFYCAHHDLSNAPSHDLLRKLYFFFTTMGPIHRFRLHFW